MTIQVQRFVQETQQWRTVRMFESFPEAGEFVASLPWAAELTDAQLDEYERIGLLLSTEAPKWLDVVLIANFNGELILRHQRQDYDPMGYMFVNIRPDVVALNCRGYTEVKGTFVHGAVPYAELRECVKWIHAK